MKSTVKSKIFGNILSDGSFNFLNLPSFHSQKELNCKNLDLNNHPVWTGKRPKEQTEISIFVGKFIKSL
uniref:Ribosomal protein L31 n=2 Tax=Undaria pinnatifida TaxID=74381 RepID=V9PB22_UNDPI|nr:ribosomal protein L31 [Undaria pinnatifida]YP_011008454.1 ribosomal protein L31 [Undaria peterseniana]AGW46854.1 ribosomal protein L31 [Undaria pinnatifida]WBP70425.1 ribosomal protein L31 [Undaria peterseniana]